MKYDSAGNIANSVSTPLSLNNAKLVFHRLDDGVMGGLSSTNQAVMNTMGSGLLFAGTINTNGGGFTSIRSPLDNALPADAKGIKLKVRGLENNIVTVTRYHAYSIQHTACVFIQYCFIG